MRSKHLSNSPANWLLLVFNRKMKNTNNSPVTLTIDSRCASSKLCLLFCTLTKVYFNYCKVNYILSTDYSSLKINFKLILTNIHFAIRYYCSVDVNNQCCTNGIELTCTKKSCTKYRGFRFPVPPKKVPVQSTIRSLVVILFGKCFNTYYNKYLVPALSRGLKSTQYTAVRPKKRGKREKRTKTNKKGSKKGQKGLKRTKN